MIRTALTKLKSGTEDLNYGRPNIYEIVNEYSKSHSNLTIVDLGAGHGDDLARLKDINGRTKLIAVENHKPYRLELESIGIKTHAVDIEKEKLPFKNASIDIIVANQIIEHTKEIFWIFNEIHRSLKPGGITIIGVPNLASAHNRVALLFGMQPTTIELYSAHVRGITASSFKRFIEKDGYFRVNKIQGANFYPFPKFVAVPLSKLFPRFSVGLTFCVEKTDKKGEFIDILENAHFETPFYTGR